MWYCLASVDFVSDILMIGINRQNNRNKVMNRPNEPINMDQSTQVGWKYAQALGK